MCVNQLGIPIISRSGWLGLTAGSLVRTGLLRIDADDGFEPHCIYALLDFGIVPPVIMLLAMSA
jgi:hypothetical protein